MNKDTKKVTFDETLKNESKLKKENFLDQLVNHVWG
jgi:hypothetical protein